MARIVCITGETRTPLRQGWHCAVVMPGATPADADFIAARVPGTAAQALIEAGRWSWDAPIPLDERDVWYRCDFEARGAQRLEFDGLATIADVFLDGEHIASSRSMFVPLTCDVNSHRQASLGNLFPRADAVSRKQGARAHAGGRA